MSDIFQIAGVGMLQGQQQLQAISLNTANASSTGYRRQVVLRPGFEAAWAASDSSPPFAHGRPAGSIGVDMRPGALRVTGRSLDLAIENDDLFFGVTDGVKTWLTRAGSFLVDEEGFLATEGGLRVMGTQGEIRVPSGELTVTADGRIEHQGDVVAALQLYRPLSGSALHAVQGSLLDFQDGARPVDSGAGRVRSGALETSNSDVAKEMVGLVALTRQYESLSMVLQGYDAAFARTVQKLGEM